MNDALLLMAFFAVVMGGVVAAGYYVLYRSSATSAIGIPIEAPEPVSARQFLTDSLRSLGEAVPGKAAGEDPMRRKLQTAGYRSPSAVATYNGIVYSSAAILAIIAGAGVLIAEQSLSAALL